MKYRLFDTGKIHKGTMKIIRAIIVPQMCRRCKVYSRRNGSAFCEHCAEEYNKSNNKTK